MNANNAFHVHANPAKYRKQAKPQQPEAMPSNRPRPSAQSNATVRWFVFCLLACLLAFFFLLFTRRPFSWTGCWARWLPW